MIEQPDIFFFFADLSFKVPRLNADEVLSSEGGLAKDYMEKFNRSMMEQYLEHQRRVQQSFRRWELEKQRQHEQSMERWRTQAEEHTKQMFGMFVQVMNDKREEPILCNFMLLISRESEFLACCNQKQVYKKPLD